MINMRFIMAMGDSDEVPSFASTVRDVMSLQEEWGTVAVYDDIVSDDCCVYLPVASQHIDVDMMRLWNEYVDMRVDMADTEYGAPLPVGVSSLGNNHYKWTVYHRGTMFEVLFEY